MAFGEKLVYEVTSPLAHYRIIDGRYSGRPARILFGDQASPQSGLALDDDDELLFNYNQRFLEISLSVQPHSALVIGGGAFTLPRALLEHFPNLQLDVVEIDPVLPTLAHQFFGLPETKRLTIHNQDGRQFIDQSSDRYDLIIIDAFSGFTIPRQLLTLDAAASYADHLNPSGVLSMNFISDYENYKMSLGQQVIATFQTAFPVVELYRAGRELPLNFEQNLVLVAAHEPTALDYLQAEPERILPVLDDAIRRDVY